MYSLWGLKRSSDRTGNLPSPLKTASTSLGFPKKTIVLPITVFLNIGPYFAKASRRAAICSSNLTVFAKLNASSPKYGKPMVRESRRRNEHLPEGLYCFLWDTWESSAVFQKDSATKSRLKWTGPSRPYTAELHQGHPTTVFSRMLLDAVLGYLEYF